MPGAFFPHLGIRLVLENRIGPGGASPARPVRPTEFTSSTTRSSICSNTGIFSIKSFPGGYQPKPFVLSFSAGPSCQATRVGPAKS